MEKDARVRDEEEVKSEEHLAKAASQIDEDEKLLGQAVDTLNKKTP